MDIVSPESTTTLGFSVGSSQPHCPVSLFAGSTWCLPAGFCSAPFSAATCACAPGHTELAAINRVVAKVLCDEIIVRFLFCRDFPGSAESIEGERSRCSQKR